MTARSVSARAAPPLFAVAFLLVLAWGSSPVSAELVYGDVVSQPLPPAVAGVDYRAFPTLDDPSASHGAEYHVSATGSDQNTGTRDRPLETLERALEVAGDGDRVIVSPGTYSSDGLTITQSNFLLTSDGRGAVTVRAQGPDARIGLDVSQPGQHDVLIRGLSLDGFSELGIHYGHSNPVRRICLHEISVSGSSEGMASWHDSAEVVAEGLYVRRLRLDGIDLIGFHTGIAAANDVRISGLRVTGTGAGGSDTAADAVAFEGGRNILLENVLVENVSGDGLDFKASGVAVVNAVVRHVGRNGIKLWDGGELVNCLVYDTGADAQLVTEAGSYVIRNCTFADHLVGGESSYAATFGYDSPGSHVEIDLQNCLFFRQPGPIFLPEGADVRVDHCVFWGFPDALFDWAGETLGSPVLPSLGPGNRVLDPLLAAPSSGDYRPTESSPLVGGGTAVPPAPCFDLVLRPRGVGITKFATVGALEHEAGGTAPTPRPSEFADVSPGQPYHTSIVGLAGLGVVGGYGDGTFRPQNPLWRAQYAKMIVGWMSLHSGLVVDESLVYPFNDQSVGPDDPLSLYPHDYIAAAHLTGTVEGYVGGAFRPYHEVARCQVVTMVVRAATEIAPGVLQEDVTAGMGTLGDFSDAHARNMAIAEHSGLLVGLQGFGISWDPWEPASRGECADILWRLEGLLDMAG